MIEQQLILFERISLRHQAKIDARLGWPPPKSQNNSNNDPSNIKPITPFVKNEMFHFNARRDSILANSKSFVRFCKANKAPRFYIRYTRISNAISILDAQIHDLTVRLKTYQECTKAKIAIETFHMKRFEAINNTHRSKLYQNKIEKIQKEEVNFSCNIYNSIIVLLGEKIRLINQLEKRIRAVRSRHFYRLSFYFTKANELGFYKAGIDSTSITEEILESACGSQLLGEYETELKNAGDYLQTIEDKISILTAVESKQ